jgi:hypothetical protein
MAPSTGPVAGDLNPMRGGGERVTYLLLDQGGVIIDEQQMRHGWLTPAGTDGKPTDPAHFQGAGTARPGTDS